MESQPARVGVIGVGAMGGPIAARLHSAGVTLAIADVRPDAAAVAETIDVPRFDTVAELAAASTVVVTVLPGPADVRDVMEPVLSNLDPGDAWIDMTSGVPTLTEEIRAQAAPGVRSLECPVGGGPDDAGEGRLLGYLGAEEEDQVTYRWLIDLLCDELVHVGPPGTGYLVKLLANLLWFGQAIAVSEVLAFSARRGLDPQRVAGTLSRSRSSSEFLRLDAGKLLQGDDMKSFALDRCVEELEEIVELGDRYGLTLPVAPGVRDVYRRALRRYGDVDGELLGARLVAEDLGVEFGDRRRRP